MSYLFSYSWFDLNIEYLRPADTTAATDPALMAGVCEDNTNPTIVFAPLTTKFDKILNTPKPYTIYWILVVSVNALYI